MKSENIYEMWYVGGNPQGDLGIGYATSPDGIHWTKYGAQSRHDDDRAVGRHPDRRPDPAQNERRL